MGHDDHACEWKDEAERLAAELAATREEMAGLAATLEKLQRHVFGKRSEKMPPVGEALRKAGVESDPAAALEKRRENAEKKRQLVTREIHHKVPEEQKTCPKCGGHDFAALGAGKLTELYEMLPSIIERQLHVQEKLRCKCGETILTAPGAARVYDKARYGPNFMANVVVAKVADAIPLHRQAKQFNRAGVPMSRSTLVDLFHQCALLAMVAFGGASALLPELHRVVVEQRQWMDERTFAQLFAIAQAAPGPNLLVFSLIGWQVAGVAGAVVATLGFCLPMSLVIFVLFRHWERFRDAPWRHAVQTGVAPLAVGLVFASSWFIGAATGGSAGAVLVVAMAAAGSLWTRWHPLWLIGLGAIVGGLGWV